LSRFRNGRFTCKLFNAHVEDIKCTRCHQRLDRGTGDGGVRADRPRGQARAPDLGGRAFDNLVTFSDGTEARSITW
jgi:hypothetical protein